MSEQKRKKAINFDLDTNVLNDIHPSGSYHKAYQELKKFFEARDFEHRQGSGYVSKERLSRSDIYDIIDEMRPELPWISAGTKRFDVTDVGPQYDLVDEITGANDTNFNIDSN